MRRKQYQEAYNNITFFFILVIIAGILYYAIRTRPEYSVISYTEDVLLNIVKPDSTPVQIQSPAAVVPVLKSDSIPVLKVVKPAQTMVVSNMSSVQDSTPKVKQIVVEETPSVPVDTHKTKSTSKNLIAVDTTKSLSSPKKAKKKFLFFKL